MVFFNNLPLCTYCIPSLSSRRIMLSHQSQFLEIIANSQQEASVESSKNRSFSLLSTIIIIGENLPNHRHSGKKATPKGQFRQRCVFFTTLHRIKIQLNQLAGDQALLPLSFYGASHHHSSHFVLVQYSVVYPFLTQKVDSLGFGLTCTSAEPKKKCSCLSYPMQQQKEGLKRSRAHTPLFHTASNRSYMVNQCF